MKTEKLIFKFEESKEDFSYENKVILVNDKKLIRNFGCPNIKNGNSSLLIKSLDNLPIYDVIQLKIKVADTGVFLVSFKKEDIDESKREEILSKIKSLKDDVTPTYETQLGKIKKLIKIINFYNPIYIAYKNTGDIKVNYNSIKTVDVTSPLLVLEKQKKNKKTSVSNKHKDDSVFNKYFNGLTKNDELDNSRDEIEKKIDFPLFSLEYIFTTIFSLLFSFGFVTGIFEILNGQSLAIFLLILAGIFICVEYYTVFSTLYKRGELKYKGLRYWLLIYNLVGTGIGFGTGFVVSKFALKTEVENLDFNKLLLITLPSVFVITSLSIFASILINYIVKRIKKY